MPYITLDTYAPMDREDYDDVLRIFTVPYSWLSDEFKADNFGTFDLDGFLTQEYTWDDTFFLYERATTDKVIVYEQIIERQV